MTQLFLVWFVPFVAFTLTYYWLTTSSVEPFASAAMFAMGTVFHVIYILLYDTRSTQPCIPPGSLNRVPASAGVRAGMSPLSGGR